MASRQEVLNVILAQLLNKRGVIAAPEQILKKPMESIKLPDVLVDFNGLRLIIEAEFEGAGAEQKAYKSAKQRVESALAHIAFAVIYPAKLKTCKFSSIERTLEGAKLRFALVTEVILDPVQQELFKEGIPQFYSGSINELASSLRQSYEQLVRDETLENVVNMLQADIESFASAVWTKRGPLGRLAEILNVGQSVLESNRENVANRQCSALIRVTALIFANAMIYQQILSETDPKIRSLDKIAQDENVLTGLLNEWESILKINYYPIFFLANKLLGCLTSDKDVLRALKKLLRTAQSIVLKRASLRHDLAGRIYHRLLEEAKYLGAYYTSIPAAALLLKLALQPDYNSQNWSSETDIAKFKIADLACGTGTLLMSAADVVVDNYVRACAARKKKPNLKKIQKIIIENVIYGYDVLDSAIHLTASTLALRVPESPIDKTHLYALRLGGEKGELGSLEFLKSEAITGTLFAKPEQVTGKKMLETSHAQIPKLDLCVMNPPFTRSVGGNLLFGNLPEQERDLLQTKLKKIVSTQGVSASIIAGLGPVFVALGDRNIKVDGRIALVLPRALLSGVAWKKTRDILAESYHLEYLIVCHEPGHWNFSENTSLSEVLLIARKLNKVQNNGESRVICINLWKHPQTAIEASNMASLIREQDAPDLATGDGGASIIVKNTKCGESIAVPWKELRSNSWNYPCSFAQTELTRTLYHLRKGKLHLPRSGMSSQIPLCPLRIIGDLGFDCKAIHNGFMVSGGKTIYPAFWNHDTKRVSTVSQKPNEWLEPKSSLNKDTTVNKAHHLWQKAGRVLLTERLRFNTMRLSSIRIDEEVLSNVWWPLILNENTAIKPEVVEKALVLWLNSTLGLLILMGERVETEGPWVKFKKTNYLRLPILDIFKLKKRKLDKLAKVYDRLSKEDIQRLPNIDTDEVRAAIDNAISEALDIPDFGILRELLAREPIISLNIDKLISPK